MKVFLAALAIWIGLQLLPLHASAQPADALLIVEVSSLDSEAAARLRQLTGQPGDNLALPAAHDPHAARDLLAHSAAARAAILDTAARRVYVLEPDGRVYTRVIDGEPTPYLVAFVASELLSLDPGHAAPPRPPRARSLARVDGQLGLELVRAVVHEASLRPKLALGLWLAGPRQRRTLALLGVELAGPSSMRHTFMAEGAVKVRRWDTALRAGVVHSLGRVQLLAFARVKLGLQRARYSDDLLADPSGQSFAPTQNNQHTRSLGLGAGLMLAYGVTPWLSLAAGTDLDTMLRRSLFTVHGTNAVREPLLMLSGNLSLLFHSPWQ